MTIKVELDKQEMVFINDVNDRVKRIGSVYMTYNRSLERVGGLEIIYNRRGQIVDIDMAVEATPITPNNDYVLQLRQ
jgi:hypothetical protein